MSFTPEQVSLIKAAADFGLSRGVKLFLVGGAVRDLLLGHGLEDKDIDFMVEGEAIPFAKEFASKIGGTVKDFPNFHTAKILNSPSFEAVAEIDFASAREESYSKPGALPDVSIATVTQDLKRRDFTINAMALEVTADAGYLRTGPIEPAMLKPLLVDNFGGFADLQHKLVRIIHPRSFVDDPTRIFRGCRYALRISGKLETATEKALIEALNSNALETVSNFRKLSELKAICSEKDPAEVFRLLSAYGVFDVFLFYDRSHEVEFLDALTRLAELPINDTDGRYELLLAIAFSSLGDPRAEARFRELGFGRKRILSWAKLLAEGRQGKISKN